MTRRELLAYLRGGLLTAELAVKKFGEVAQELTDTAARALRAAAGQDGDDDASKR